MQDNSIHLYFLPFLLSIIVTHIIRGFLFNYVNIVINEYEKWKKKNLNLDSWKSFHKVNMTQVAAAESFLHTRHLGLLILYMQFISKVFFNLNDYLARSDESIL